MMQFEEMLKDKIKEVLDSKVEEFHMLGYDAVQAEDIWACVSANYKGELPMLHTIVNDIFSLKTSKFMNWLTLSAYTGKFDSEKSTLL